MWHATRAVVGVVGVVGGGCCCCWWWCWWWWLLLLLVVVVVVLVVLVLLLVSVAQFLCVFDLNTQWFCPGPGYATAA